MVASILFITDAAKDSICRSKEKTRREKISSLSVSAILLCMLMLQCTLEGHFLLTYTFNDGFTNTHSVMITEGPEKGIVTTVDNAEFYNRVFSDTKPVRELGQGPVLYLSADSWEYLADRKKSASYSGWLSTNYPEYSQETLLAYWGINEDKFPSAVYIDKAFPAVKEMIEFFNSCHFFMKETDLGFIFEKQSVGF